MHHPIPISTRSLLLALVVSAALSACGQKEAAAPGAAPATPTPAAASTAPVATAPAPAATPAAPAVAENTAGKSTYGKTCAMCHAASIAGAPKPGDKAEWAPRIAQGNDTLYKHAIEGFTGAKGMMPARGGAASLSDGDVKAAVDYMVAQSR